MKTFASSGMLVVCLFFGVSQRVQSTEIAGEIFIVTGGHESVKLGLVEIAAFKRSDVTAPINATEQAIAEETKRFDEIIPQIRDSETQAKERAKTATDRYAHNGGALSEEVSKATHDAWDISSKATKIHERARDRIDYRESAAPFFKALPQPIATTKSDADGKFKIQLASSGKFVIAARAQRRVVRATEYYFWLVGLDGSATVTLSNDNLTDSSSSESIVHTVSPATLVGDQESAEALTSDLQELIKRLNAKSISTPPPPTDPNVVTLTERVSIPILHGVVGISAGTKLQLVTRVGDKVRVHYEGADYDIPVSATDLK